MNRPSIDIILPCYNPQKGWSSTVVDAFKMIEQNAVNWKPNLIIVNDGSTQQVEIKDINYIQNSISSFKWISYSQNKGKGFALRRGVEESTGDFILLTDIDFPYTHDSLMAMAEVLINNKSNVIAGERSEKYYDHTPYARKKISKFLKSIVKDLLKIKVTDTQCGLKGMTKEMTNVFLETKINRYLFDIEFLWLAGKKHKMAAFPVKLKDNIVFSKMNFKILFIEGFNFIRFFIKTLRSNEK